MIRLQGRQQPGDSSTSGSSPHERWSAGGDESNHHLLILGRLGRLFATLTRIEKMSLICIRSRKVPSQASQSYRLVEQSEIGVPTSPFFWFWDAWDAKSKVTRTCARGFNWCHCVYGRFPWKAKGLGPWRPKRPNSRTPRTGIFQLRARAREDSTTDKQIQIIPKSS